jgi:hypothetical protein
MLSNLTTGGEGSPTVSSEEAVEGLSRLPLDEQAAAESPAVSTITATASLTLTVLSLRARPRDRLATRGVS